MASEEIEIRRKQNPVQRHYMATITTWTLCSCRHRTNPCISEQRHVDVYFGRLREKHRPDECPSSPTRKKLKLEHHSPAHQEQPGVLRPTRFSSELLVEAVFVGIAGRGRVRQDRDYLSPRSAWPALHLASADGPASATANVI